MSGTYAFVNNSSFVGPPTSIHIPYNGGRFPGQTIDRASVTAINENTETSMRTTNTGALTASTFRSRTRLGLSVMAYATSVWSAFATYRRRRRIEAELYELDERMLRDIGLTRTEIPYLARQHNR